MPQTKAVDESKYTEEEIANIEKTLIDRRNQTGENYLAVRDNLQTYLISISATPREKL